MGAPDPRIGGFGPFFALETIVALLAAGAVTATRRGRGIVDPAFMIALGLAAITAIFPWLARYAPFFWGVPIFLALTGNMPRRERSRAAWQAVALAGGVIVVFAVGGQQILHYLGISLPALQGAGGVLLLLVALELLTGRADDPAQVTSNVALVPIGTPPRAHACAGRTAFAIACRQRSHASAQQLNT